MSGQFPRTSLSDVLHWFRYRRLRPRLWRLREAPRLRADAVQEFVTAAGLPRDAGEAWTIMRSRLKQRLFFDAENRKEFFLGVLTSLQPYDDILDEADEVLGNRFETLGSGLVSLGDDIDWHRDFKTGQSWPVTDPSDLDLLQEGRPSDVKVPWELSRFHQNWWLGKAYWLSNRQEYAEKFVALTDDWIQGNPVGKGVNWAQAMEAAIRASNWIMGYSFFAGSPAIPPEFWLRFFASLYAHGVFIEMNLEFALVRKNHFLANVAGLIVLGCFFRGTAFGDRWYSWGLRQLETEMARQVHEDGVNIEKSTSYQRLVLEMFYVPALLAERNGHRFSEAFRSRLQNMFRFVASYQRPDGSIPAFGDSDDGRLFRISRKQDVNDCRPALCIGASIFGDPDARKASGGFRQEALWLIGTSAFEEYRRPVTEGQEPESTLYPQGGFAIFRTKDVHVMADVGTYGADRWGGHGHSDILSFEYWADGHPLIVDSGTFTYSGDEAARQQFRGIRAHNSLVVDEADVVQFRGIWGIRRDDTRPAVLQWSQGSDRDILTAKHEGYRGLPDPVILTRTFDLDRSTGTMTITDDVRGNAEHRLLLSIHLHPSVQLESDVNNGYILLRGGHRYRVRFSESGSEPAEAWFSPSYGVKEKTVVIRLRRTALLPHTIHTTIERLHA